MTIFGTRPEVIKVFPVIENLGKSPRVEAINVSTSQHREMIGDLIKLFSIKVDYDFMIMHDNQSLSDISVRVLSSLDPLLRKVRPDLVLVQGDTTTASIGALSAFYNKIPIGHVEAGLRSLDKMSPYPEEINRRLVSLLADLHFAPTTHNAQNLRSEKVDPSRIFVTGNTVIDSLLYISKKNRRILDKYLPSGALISHRMILVTAHRRENWGEPLENLCYALLDLVKSYLDIEIVYPVHLNPNVRKTVFNMLRGKERIHLLDPLPYEAFVEAMVKAHLIITDSGGIQEEGPSLGTPILVFRKVTERPEGLVTGVVKLIGIERENVVREASLLLESQEVYEGMVAMDNPYGDGHAAQRIVEAIFHYFNHGPRPSDFNG
jgi:UDP-N-acetylglucosamine 2-epimerase (non-hydrolysing)